MKALIIALIWLLLIVLFVLIHWVIRRRISRKCNHRYQVTGSVQMSERVLLFLECVHCGRHIDISILNKNITIQIYKNDELFKS